MQILKHDHILFTYKILSIRAINHKTSTCFCVWRRKGVFVNPVSHKYCGCRTAVIWTRFRKKSLGFVGLPQDRRVATSTSKEMLTHFEKSFQSALNFGPNQRTLNFFSKCVKFRTNLTHFEFFFQSALRLSFDVDF